MLAKDLCTRILQISYVSLVVSVVSTIGSFKVNLLQIKRRSNRAITFFKSLFCRHSFYAYVYPVLCARLSWKTAFNVLRKGDLV